VRRQQDKAFAQQTELGSSELRQAVTEGALLGVRPIMIPVALLIWRSGQIRNNQTDMGQGAKWHLLKLPVAPPPIEKL